MDDDGYDSKIRVLNPPLRKMRREKGEKEKD